MTANSGNGVCHVYGGDVTVHAAGSAFVKAGGGVVHATDDVVVRAYERATVHANGYARVDASGQARVFVSGNARVTARDDASVIASGLAIVETRDGRPRTLRRPGRPTETRPRRQSVVVTVSDNAIWIERACDGSVRAVHTAPGKV